MLGENGIALAINGIGGRIGSNTLRAMIEHPRVFNIVAGNDLALDLDRPAENFIQCKAHDSTFGPWPCDMESSQDGKNLILRGSSFSHTVQFLSIRDPRELPWEEMGIVGVAECTGVFRTRESGGKPGYDSHLQAGAKSVALSVPAKDDVLTIVYGTHKRALLGEPLLSAASCTSGSIAFPLRCLLDRRDELGFASGSIVTVHAYTAGEQQLQDRPGPMKPGSRRIFAGAQNIVPTTTGAAKAIPKLEGLGDDMEGIPFDGFALRVPVVSGSVTLLQVVLSSEPDLESVLRLFREAAQGPMVGKFAVNEDPTKSPHGRPLVSSHIIKRPESSILDIEFSSKLGALYTFSLWYGNEWGYVLRLIEALSEQCGT